MKQAEWNGVVLAESNDVVEVEGNAYFPADSLNKQYFKPSQTETVCHWKGTANYYDLQVGEKTNPSAAWFYKDPLPAAEQIKDRVSFWKGVTIKDA